MADPQEAGPLVVSQWDEALHALILAQRPQLRLQAIARGVPAALPPQAQVLLARPFSAAERVQPPPPGWPFGLRWVQLLSVGIDNYPPWLLRTPGLAVSTAQGSSSAVIAEFVLAALLRVAQRLDERRAHDSTQWRFTAAPGLAGATVGLVGFGGIGRALAGRLLALGARVQALRHSDAPLGLDGVERAADLAALLRDSDHLVLAAPGTAETRHLIDAAALAQARPGLHLVNIARGSLVDQQALRAALDDGRVGWASLDVTEPEPLPAGHWLYTHPQVWLTPHTCTIGPPVQRAVAALFVDNLDRWLSGQAPASLVDLERGY